MADLNIRQQRALGTYWGVIQAAAAQHMTTADLWAAIRGAAEQAGLASPGVNASDISVLRGYAGAMVRAADALAASEPGLGLTSSMIATAPWARPLAEQNLSPMFQATYKITGLSPTGAPVEGWLTSVFNTQTLPGTVGELLDQLSQDTLDMIAATPDGEENPSLGDLRDLVGVSAVSVVRV